MSAELVLTLHYIQRCVFLGCEMDATLTSLSFAALTILYASYRPHGNCQNVKGPGHAAVLVRMPFLCLLDVPWHDRGSFKVR
jgi:hypothetical protein